MPELDEEVTVRYGDLVALEADRTALAESLECARDDLRDLQVALGVAGEDNITAHQLVVSHLLPRIRKLVETEGHVRAAEAQIIRIAGAAGGPELDLGNGRKARRVGQRLPPEIAKQVLRKPPHGGHKLV